MPCDFTVADRENKPLTALNTRGWYKTLLSLDGNGESGLKTMPRSDKSFYSMALYCTSVVVRAFCVASAIINGQKLLGSTRLSCYVSDPSLNNMKVLINNLCFSCGSV